MSAPLGYQPHHAATELPAVEQMQAEVDAEQTAALAAKRAETAALKEEVAALRAQLAASPGATVTAAPVAVAPDVDEEERELLAAGCVKILLYSDDEDDIHVFVKPQSSWHMMDFTFVAMGNYLAWAQNCLATDDDVTAFTDANLGFTQLKEFFARWREATGQDDPGKPQESRRSSRRTPRR